MPFGSSIVLIAAGAILRYAVSAHVSGVSLKTIGVILMVVGVIGVILSLLWMFAWRPHRETVARDTVIERQSPI